MVTIKMKVSIVLLLFVTLIQAICQAIILPPNRDNRVLQIFIPRNILEDFEYEPIKQGYRYSYLLVDGTRREEIGYVTDPETDQGVLAMEALMKSNPASGTRPTTNNKSRKLSPKTLQGLAG